MPPLGVYRKWRGVGPTPPITTNLILNVDLLVPTSVTIDGSNNVSALADLSGAGNGMAQVTAGSRPAFNASDANMNGFPSCAVASGKGIFGTPANLPQPFTLYVVGWLNLTSGADLFDGNTGAGGRVGFGMNSTGFYLFAQATPTNFGPTRDAKIHAFAASFNGASTQAFMDSSATIATFATAGTNALNNPAFAGAFPGTGATSKALLYTGTHTAVQMAATSAYLGARFGKAWN